MSTYFLKKLMVEKKQRLVYIISTVYAPLYLPAGRQGSVGKAAILNKMKYYVYAVVSRKDNGLYIGISKNPEKRLKEHNSGMTKATKARRPFLLFYKEELQNRKLARDREKYLKSGIGREFLKRSLQRLNIDAPL